jgi:hypothetical protein
MSGWNIFFSILISFVCGVAVNLGTPTIQSFFTWSVTGFRKARLDYHKARLEILLFYDRNKMTLILTLLEGFLLASMCSVLAFVLLRFSLEYGDFLVYSSWRLFIGVALGRLWYAWQLARGVVSINNTTTSLRNKIERIERKIGIESQVATSDSDNS